MVLCLVRQIRSHREGYPSNYGLGTYSLDVKACQDLIQSVRSDESLGILLYTSFSMNHRILEFVKLANFVPYRDYFHFTRRLVLRMVIELHEAAIIKVAAELQR
jgi:hypothetical protein